MHGEYKKNYKKVHASRPSAGDSIEDRPEEIDERTAFGHWEMDCVVSARRSLKRLLELTERRQSIRREPQKNWLEKILGFSAFLY